MEYVVANIAVYMLLAALVGFVSAGLSAWGFFRSLGKRQALEHRMQIESVQADLEVSAKKIRETEATSEEWKGAMEAHAAKLCAFEAKLRAQEASAKTELRKKEIEIGAMRQESKQVGVLEAELTELKSANQVLEAKVSDHGQGAAVWQVRFDEFAKVQDTKSREFEGVIAMLREEASSAGLQKQAAESQAREIEKEFRKVMAMREEEFLAMQSQTRAAVEVQKRFENDFRALRIEMESRDAEIARLVTDVDTAHRTGRELEQVREDLQGVRANLAERNEAIAKFEADSGLLSHVRNDMRERQTRIDGLQLQLTNAKQEIGSLQVRLSARNDEMSRLESDAALLSHLRQRMGERQTRLDRLELQLQGAKQELSALQLELANRDERLESMQLEFAEANAALERQIQLLESNLVTANATVIEDPRIAAPQLGLASARSVADADSKALQTYISDVAALRLDLADRDERLEAWESRYESALGQMHAEAGLSRMAQTQQVEVKPLAFGAAVGGGASLASIAPITTAEPTPHMTIGDRLELQARLRFYSLRGIQFLPESDQLRPESIPSLQEVLSTLQLLDAEHRVEIGGHTDSWGHAAHNRELSLRRANAVRLYLVEHGAPTAMLIATGYGDSRPIADNDDADGRFANRRIEFQVRGPVR